MDGVWVDSSNILVKDCYAASQTGVGMQVVGSNIKVISNTVEDILEYECMFIVDRGGSVFKNSTVRRCKRNGMRINSSNPSTYADNTFDSTTGTSIVVDGGFDFDGNTITGNRIIGSGADGIELNYGSGAMAVAGNVIVNSAEN